MKRLCPRCGGSGDEVRVAGLWDCETCEGTGEINVPWYVQAWQGFATFCAGSMWLAAIGMHAAWKKFKRRKG